MRWYNDYSKLFLEKDYLLPGQTVDARLDIISERAEDLLKISGFARDFRANLDKGWYSLSTPVWTNYGTRRGLPISCFGSYIEDTSESILYNLAEIGMMTKHGGGTSAVFSALRGRGASIRDNGESGGAVHFHGPYDSVISTFSQGSTRRGNFASYLRIDHPDIYEFLTIKSEGSPFQDIFFGVVIPEGWMKSMIDGDKQKRQVWAKVLTVRKNIGLPYLMFQDNAQTGAPDVYQGVPIHHSNLCTEIMLPNNKDESFVCCLSSMNVKHFDEWKGTNAVELLTFFLDSVMTEFVEKAQGIPFMERPVRFAERHRALGLGWLGWHDYLQDHSIPFENFKAMQANAMVAKAIWNDAYAASHKLAGIYGEPEMLKGKGRRNTTLMAIAPTKSSSFILGQASEGIEPIHDNIYIKDLAKGKYTVRNRALEAVLAQKGENTQAVWDSIAANRASVSHLSVLSDHEKEVFRTFKEISPLSIVQQAAQRQRWVDQGQSVNVFIHPKTPTKDVNTLYCEAWSLGLKSLYYQKNNNAAQELARDLLACKACES